MFVIFKTSLWGHTGLSMLSWNKGTISEISLNKIERLVSLSTNACT